MYRSLGMDLPACAKFLHVSTRTVHNWESGKHDIPYATYRLLRLLNRMELPGRTWQGWCFHGGKLISPEGRTFEGTDSAWWGRLTLQARMCSEFQEKLRAAVMQVREREASAQAQAAAGQRSAAAAALGAHLITSPLVITGRSHGVPSYEIRHGMAYARR
ncbi:VC1465 family Xer recombination activation factor [Comamonas sp. E6]|uniref:VC1465 family Xer recombination activation factor n=1 Tax=Comamonas sp. E6 TaxID=364029 RepID=UPI000750779A